MSLARVLYGGHAIVIVALGLILFFGRARDTDFVLFVVLSLLGFLLSGVLFVLTVFRRHGFSYGRTLALFVAAPVFALVATAAQGAWAESRWPRNRDCLQGLAAAMMTAFPDIAESELLILDAYGRLESSHRRSADFAGEIRACALRSVAMTREQIEFWSDEFAFLSLPGGYVLRYRGSPELVYCPYIMAGRDDKPPRALEPRWYYCR